MVRPLDPEAERIKRKRERKERSARHVQKVAILAALRQKDLYAAARILLKITGDSTPLPAFDEECPACVKRQSAA